MRVTTAAIWLLFFGQKMVPYLVCGFDKSTLSTLVRECFDSEFPDIFHKKQIDYIFRYLRDLEAKTIVLEFSYIDKDYLDDFSRFYVRRFSGKGHKCARLHFFSENFDHSDLSEMIVTNPQDARIKKLKASYLGFSVVKPLPQTFIGKTCLKTYSAEPNAVNQKKLARAYEINLFGLSLTVESIAFQEQDKVVSACATTAIWSALHALQWRPVREIPSCSKITIEAINFIEGSSNSFPSRELSNKQILRALDVEGLKHHTESLRGVSQEDLFKKIKIYLDSDLPLILGVMVFSICKVSKKLIERAGHAVTILGYKSAPHENAIYLHDDRLGPYARATFRDLCNYEKLPLFEQINQVGLVLQEKSDDGKWQPPHEILVPEILIAATDKKVRIPLIEVTNTIARIATITKTLAESLAPTGPERSELECSIRLAEIGKIKTEIRESLTAKSREKIGETPNALIRKNKRSLTLKEEKDLDFLTQSFARFQWVVDFYFENKPVFSMLVDATDIPQGDAVSAVRVYDSEEFQFVFEAIRRYPHLGTEDPFLKADWGFIASFARKLQDKDQGLTEHLNKTYGDLRAPAYFKPLELQNGVIQKNSTSKIFYEPTEKSIAELFPINFSADVEEKENCLIWVITYDGALLIGKEVDQMGHPCLTEFKPARIAGELHYIDKKWRINAKSGRYSKSYRNSGELLKNALRKFQNVFWKSCDQIVIQSKRKKQPSSVASALDRI
ncbi:hypothetical protein ACSFA3_06320 [Variovorax sp. RHLX14]|uniref:hypothetical protein n=1 Tax=Variovorax sp. RHLX14 TaxID=1259731 RepID=UPI003F4808CE